MTLLSGRKLGAVRVLGLKGAGVIEVACFRQAGYRDFKKGKLRNGDMGGSMGVKRVAGRPTRYHTLFLTYEMAELLLCSLNDALGGLPQHAIGKRIFHVPKRK